MPKRKMKQPLELDLDIEQFDDDDITTSEDELSDSEKKILEKVRQKRVPENYDSEDEVFALHSDKDEDEDDDDDDDDDDDQIHDSMESDLDQPGDDDGLPNDRAWGSKKKTYYNTDYVDPDYATTNPKDLEAAEAEEREAILIQERLAREMDDADYGLDILSKKAQQDDDVSCEVIKVDYSTMTQTQKLELFHRDNPEFSSIVDAYERRLEELKDILQPIISLIKEKNVVENKATKFLQTKYELSLSYCVNASFYLMLKAKKIPVNSHPVIQRLAQFEQLLNQLEERGKDLMEDVSAILEAYKNGQPVYNSEDTVQKEDKGNNKKTSSKKKKQVVDEVNDVSEKMSKKMKKVTICEPKEVESEDDEEEELQSMDVNENDNKKKKRVAEIENLPIEEKRAITYEIAKNKGLTPYRKKEQRNPRVKHRNKYRKAQIRRKGAIREVRKELERYSGEISGIKASVKKSIKLK